MSFKMDFFGKMMDQFRGLFQNQKSSSSTVIISSTNAMTTASGSVVMTGSSNINIGSTCPLVSHQTGMNYNCNFEGKPQPKCQSRYNQITNSKCDQNPNETLSQLTNMREKGNHWQHQQMSPSSFSLSTWSTSPGTSTINASTNTSNVTTSPFNNYTTASHLHQQPNAHQVFYHYPQNQRSLHQEHQHYSSNSNYNNQSSSSSSTSFGPVPLTPSSITARAVDNFISSGIGPRSYSAINTPESPGNFRRQHSLNVNQRIQASSRLQLDLRSQKNSPLYAKQSASTDLIDKHSLSPRPRPKDLIFSNSQDNMLKSHINNNQRNGSSQQQTTVNSQCQSQPRPGGLFANNINLNHKQNNGTKGCSSSHNAIYYQNRIELSRNSSSLNIDGKKYDHLKENNFKIISQLGFGSFGQVDKMIHKPSNTELAVKKMRRSGNSDDNRHVQRDLELLQKCNYKHVVQCYGYFILETEVWIFMELMNTCFDRLIKKLSLNHKTVPERIIGKVAVATIDTLDYLKEEHNVIHRDIKPSNILINNMGVIKLCDFGISGSLINSKAHTRSVGSIAYMAPERIEPPPDGTYDIRSDIWSMGITLVEIATGQFPYKNWSTDFEILSKVIQEAPPTLPNDQDFSNDFKYFINACLTKKYTKRPKYRELMTYQFYQHYKRNLVDVAEWFKHAYCDTTTTDANINISDFNPITTNRSHSSSASSLASNSTIK